MTSPQISETEVLEALRHVIDPELGCNIVDLGLVYSVGIVQGNVTVRMTLTTPGCPMHDSISWGVKNILHNLTGVTGVDLQIVWDPPWNPSMMTEIGREQVGARSF